jgi:transcriptional regulator with XRE-family HTH domain
LSRFLLAWVGNPGDNIIMYDNISTSPIGQQIRELRQVQGLSLQELARRAGTSAPALHRYEAGWDRFEIATLRRIAAALGAWLEVRLHRTEGHRSVKQPGEKQLVRVLAPLFWDRRLTTADLIDHPNWVLGRVLMYGDPDHVRAARRFYGDEAIRDAIARRGVDDRTRNYWTIIFGDSRAPEGNKRRRLENRS